MYYLYLVEGEYQIYDHKMIILDYMDMFFIKESSSREELEEYVKEMIGE